MPYTYYDPTAGLTDDQRRRLNDHFVRVVAYFDSLPTDTLHDLTPELKAEADALIAEVGDDAYSWLADSYDPDTAQ